MTSNWNVLYYASKTWNVGDVFRLPPELYFNFRVRRFDGLIIRGKGAQNGAPALFFDFNEWMNNIPEPITKKTNITMVIY